MAGARRNWRTVRRDTVIWLLGIGFTINEILIRADARPHVLVFCAGMLGLPPILMANDAAKRMLSDRGE